MTSVLRYRSPFSRTARRLRRRCFSGSAPLPNVTVEEKLSFMEACERRSFIHPSAIVHPDAVLGQDVSIGPFCTVGPAAKLGNNCQLKPGTHVSGDTELGDNCILMMGAVVGDDIPGRTVVGYNNIIGHHCVVGVKCQDMKYKPGNECFLEIGDNNEIREFTSVHRSSRPDQRTIIGDHNLIMGSCHIAHDCIVGNNNILANNTLLAGHVVLEDNVHTAGATAIHQFCQIGSFSFIGGGSVVSQDVPKYTMVSGERAELRGLNLEGLRRNGFSVVQIKSLRAAYRRIFMPRDGNCHSIEERLTKLVSFWSTKTLVFLSIPWYPVKQLLPYWIHQEQDEELGRIPAVCSMVQSIRDSFGEDRRGICKFRSWVGSSTYTPGAWEVDNK